MTPMLQIKYESNDEGEQWQWAVLSLSFIVANEAHWISLESQPDFAVELWSALSFLNTIYFLFVY